MNMLLVAHQNLFRDGIKLLLNESNLASDVKEATSLKEALNVLTGNDYDLILLDIQLPDTIGLDALREIKRQDKQTPVITITEETDAHLASQAIMFGAAGHICKTSRFDELVKAISAAKLGKVYMTSTINEQLHHGRPIKNSASDVAIISSLSDRQREVLRHLAKGTSNKAISEHMNISQNTVKAHLATIFKILGVHSRTEAFYFVTRVGMPLD